jgi:parallel beta-helix repeat protein
LVSGSAKETLVANLNGLPTALTYILNGTNATVQVEGTTVSFANWMTNGATLVGTVTDLSSNISTYTLAFGAYNNGPVSTPTEVRLNSLKIESWFNVVSFGAIPDDGLDDTAAIQAALDAADALPGVDTVYLPAGDYLVGKMLNIGGDIVLRGDGSHGSAISQMLMGDNFTAGTDLLRNKDTIAGDHNVTLTKLRFDGRSANQTGTFIHLVDMINVFGLLVDDCEFRDSKAIGMVVQGNLSLESDTKIINCYATGNELGFYAQANNGVINGLRGLIYSNCIASGNTWGFDAYLASNILYTKCEAFTNAPGHGTGFSSDSCIDLSYINCQAGFNKNCGFGVFINPVLWQQPSDVLISNCAALYNETSGFQIENARDVTLSGVRAYGNGGDGIVGVTSFTNDLPSLRLSIENAEVYSNEYSGISLVGVHDSEIRGCTVSDNSLQLAGTFSGIQILDGTFWAPNVLSSNILIRDCVVGDTGTIPKQAYGVYSGDLTDYVTLLNDDLSSNLIAPYLLVGSNNKIITSPSFAAWTYDWGVNIGSETNDFDGDGLDNLAEYALGGNPTNKADVGIVPTLRNDSGTLIYVHVQRADDSNLLYSLETSTNLMSNIWTSFGYTAVTNVTGQTFNYVTNTWSNNCEGAFFRLRIENRPAPGN